MTETDAVIIDLDKYRSVGSLRPGYKKSTKRWAQDGDRSGSFQTSHWDGRLDATIKTKAVTMKASPSGEGD